VLPVYAAGEDRIEGITGEALCEGIKAHGHKHVVCAETIAAAVAHLREALVPGDLLLTLGAGDVWKVGAEVLKDV
jgi:UDP-N-acetylmuramate--alanine ligase